MTLSPDHAILGLLAHAPQHGYQMLECFSDPACLGQIWRLNASQLYSTLKRLERDGLISGQSAPSEIGPPRTVYHLTEAGRDQLLHWLHEPSPSASIRRVRVEFPSRLFVAHLLNVPSAPIIAHQRAACQQERERLIAQSSQAADGMASLALTFAIEQLEAALRWIERCEQMTFDTLTEYFRERRPSQ
ncbi:MAG: PadR family transcriptional regulator [Anaerolineae bacterium]|nr:PadR family transcriptional regulator [Anaerolineae bacterium]MDW8300743.1 PadR family transcriptional regulator [Anaerolineae bacterium]